MSESPLYRRIMSGETGAWASPLRAGLWVAAWAYRAAVNRRNRAYDTQPARAVKLPVPVISIGNITAGGTGKTPLVLDVVRRLQERGRRPAVVSRGYKSRSDQGADELLLVRRRFGNVVTVADADRVAGGLKAIEHGADTIVLDDAFQHRRVRRDLDVVTVDATCPFGYGHLLPRGVLREPLSSLVRADLFVLSRTDMVSADRTEAIGDALRRYNPDASILRSCHRPTHLSQLDGGRLSLSALQDRKVLCVAGIGNPGAFVGTTEQIGATPIHCVRLSDHASYNAAVYSSLAGVAKRFPDAEYLVTTEKDLVKLESGLWASFPVPIVAVVIDIDLTPEDDTMLDAAIERLIAPAPPEDSDAERAVPTDRPE